ncbi:hypothetical protein [Klebsiella pneumoniae]|uniref:hypothetical protein n=1 Tax=Klebsiella pneumoniae TaxID=573 RepID=UPI0015E67F32|nr:hypothetical protein [Klebsiella pneumoniae]
MPIINCSFSGFDIGIMVDPDFNDSMENVHVFDCTKGVVERPVFHGNTVNDLKYRTEYIELVKSIKNHQTLTKRQKKRLILKSKYLLALSKEMDMESALAYTLRKLNESS